MKMEVESVICSSPPVIQPYMLCKIKKKKKTFHSLEKILSNAH